MLIPVVVSGLLVSELLREVEVEFFVADSALLRYLPSEVIRVAEGWIRTEV